VNRSFDHPLVSEEHAAAPLAGGLAQGYQCGQLWGATLAAGAEAYRLFGPGTEAEYAALLAAQRLVASFRARNKHIDCLEITGVDLSRPTMRMVIRFLIKSGATGSCFGMAARFAKAALGEIRATFAEKPIGVPAAPVSCAAKLARKMGVSDMHAVMAAGFAGGIGLSGGACGALGAAIWIAGMNSIQEGAEKTSFNSPVAAAVIDRFLKSTDYEFECAKIVGRSFQDIEDHAGHLHAGGCAEIIQALAMA